MAKEKEEKLKANCLASNNLNILKIKRVSDLLCKQPLITTELSRQNIPQTDSSQRPSL